MKHHITVSLCTRNRYHTTLPLAMVSLIGQTRKADQIIIYDDTVDDKTPNTQWIDMRQDPIIKYILATYDKLGIKWYIIYGQKKGQHFGDQTINRMAKDLVWRFDDDEVAEPDCLQKLEEALTDDVGAVGCSIEIPGQNITGTATGKLLNIRNENNMQWVGEGGFTEHLHSSFLYRAGVADFDLRLSPRSFRGETMFSHEILMKGYKLKVINNTKIHHFHEQKGGCRTPEENKTQEELYAHDENIFNKWLQIKDDKSKVAILNEGKGDCVCFRKWLDDIGIKDVKIYGCYGDLFEGLDFHPIGDAINMGYDKDKFSLYKWMDQTNCKLELYEAYKKFYSKIWNI